VCRQIRAETSLFPTNAHILADTAQTKYLSDKTSEVLRELSGNDIGSEKRPDPADKSVAETSEVCSVLI
jgi:hypothetical protein